MAYGRSYSSWRYRSRYGTRTTRRWNNGFRRRATGNAKSARQQRDAATVTINRIATTPVVISQGEQSNIAVINHWDSLYRSTYFSNYAPMYDQIKIDKIRVKVTGNQAGSAMTSNISPSVIMAFDRNGLDETQVLSTSLVSTYSSSQLKQWSSGNAFVMYQTIYPSTIMEKGQYIPTDNINRNNDPTDPRNNYSSATLPFKPITFLGVDLGFAVGSDQGVQTFAFTIEYEYTVTFRGMRKPYINYTPGEQGEVIGIRYSLSTGTGSQEYNIPFTSFLSYSPFQQTVNLLAYQSVVFIDSTSPAAYLATAGSEGLQNVSPPGQADLYYIISRTESDSSQVFFYGSDGTTIFELNDYATDDSASTSVSFDNLVINFKTTN